MSPISGILYNSCNHVCPEELAFLRADLHGTTFAYNSRMQPA